MADVIIPSGYGLCVVKHLAANVGKTSTVTWGYTLPVSGTASDNALLIRDAITDTTALFDDTQMAAGSVLTDIYVLENRAGVHTSYDLPVNLAGTRTGGAVPPPQVAVGVKKTTAFAGKAFRGRFYLPNSWLIAGDFIDNASLTGTRQGQLQTRAEATRALLLGSGVPMQVLHTAADDAPSPVLLLSIAGKLRTQRRRVPR
jgi:hypothetical protein